MLHHPHSQTDITPLLHTFGQTGTRQHSTAVVHSCGQTKTDSTAMLHTCGQTKTDRTAMLCYTLVEGGSSLAVC